MRFLNIKYKNKLKKLNWRNDLKEENLRFLLQSLFNIEFPQKIVGLVNKRNEVLTVGKVVKDMKKYEEEILTIKTEKMLDGNNDSETKVTVKSVSQAEYLDIDMAVFSRDLEEVEREVKKEKGGVIYLVLVYQSYGQCCQQLASLAKAIRTLPRPLLETLSLRYLIYKHSLYSLRSTIFTELPALLVYYQQSLFLEMKYKPHLEDYVLSLIKDINSYSLTSQPLKII